MSIIDTLLDYEGRRFGLTSDELDQLETIIENIDSYTMTDRQRAFANAIIARAFTPAEEDTPAQLRRLVDTAFQMRTKPAKREAAHAALAHPLADTLTDRQISALIRFAK